MAIPSDAQIAVYYYILENGQLNVEVRNRTSEILTIDQTKSFFINTDGTSTSYFDPTVTTTTNSTYSSETTGASLNLGAVTNALGIGGVVGTIANGINVSGSDTGGNVQSVTTQLRDLPQVSIGPKGSGTMSKEFSISGVGIDDLKYTSYTGEWTSKTSPKQFSVCISYKIGDDVEFKKIVTNFYVSATLIAPVTKGRVNDAFREIYTAKPDALSEPTFFISINNNISEEASSVYDTMRNGFLYDYQ